MLLLGYHAADSPCSHTSPHNRIDTHKYMKGYFQIGTTHMIHVTAQEYHIFTSNKFMAILSPLSCPKAIPLLSTYRYSLFAKYHCCYWPDILSYL